MNWSWPPTPHTVGKDAGPELFSIWKISRPRDSPSGTPGGEPTEDAKRRIVAVCRVVVLQLPSRSLKFFDGDAFMTTAICPFRLIRFSQRAALTGPVFHHFRGCCFFILHFHHPKPIHLSRRAPISRKG